MLKRNYGLDLLRILAMCGIITLHILRCGGVLDACKSSGIERWVVSWVDICAMCSVNVFALLSGYLGIYKAKNSVYRMAELVVTVVLYSVVICAAFKVMRPDMLQGGVKQLICGLCPPLAGRYWYITCYIPLALLQPFINKMLLSLTEQQHKVMCIVGFVLFCVIQSICMRDFFAFNAGYSFVWLLYCYIVGAYCRRVNMQHKMANIWMFICLSLVILGGKILINVIFHKNIDYLNQYISPITMIMAIILLVYFSNANLIYGKKLVASLAITAFDVYLLHCHIFIYDYIIKDNFRWIANLPVYLIPVMIILIVGSIYLVLALIGKIRIVVFKFTRLNNLVRKLSLVIDKRIYMDFGEN